MGSMGLYLKTNKTINKMEIDKLYEIKKKIFKLVEDGTKLSRKQLMKIETEWLGENFMYVKFRESISYSENKEQLNKLYKTIKEICNKKFK